MPAGREPFAYEKQVAQRAQLMSDQEGHAGANGVKHTGNTLLYHFFRCMPALSVTDFQQTAFVILPYCGAAEDRWVSRWSSSSTCIRALRSLSWLSLRAFGYPAVSVQLTSSIDRSLTPVHICCLLARPLSAALSSPCRELRNDLDSNPEHEHSHKQACNKLVKTISKATHRICTQQDLKQLNGMGPFYSKVCSSQHAVAPATSLATGWY